jgi:hypothetical protein
MISSNIRKTDAPLKDGVVDPLNRDEPREKPIITKRLLQLAAVEAY